MRWNDSYENNLEKETAEKSVEKIFPESLEIYDKEIDKVNEKKKFFEEVIKEREKEIEEASEYGSTKYFLMSEKSYLENIKQNVEIEAKALEEEKKNESYFREQFVCVDKLSKEQAEIVRAGVIDDFKIEKGKVIELSDISKKERDRLKGELDEFDMAFQRNWEAKKAEAIENAINGKSDLSIKEINESFERAMNGHDIELSKRIKEINEKVEKIDNEYKSKNTLKGRVNGFISKYINKRNNDATLEAEVKGENQSDIKKTIDTVEEKPEFNNKKLEKSSSENKIDELFINYEAKEAKVDIKDTEEEKYTSEQTDIDELFTDDEIKEDKEDIEDTGEAKYISEKTDIDELFTDDEIKEVKEDIEDTEEVKDIWEQTDIDSLFIDDITENNKSEIKEKDLLEKVIEEKYPEQTVDEVLQSILDELDINENIENVEAIENKREKLELNEKYEKYRDNLENFNDRINSLLEDIDGISVEDRESVKKRLLDTLLEQHDEAENRTIGDHGIRHILANVNRSNDLYDKYCETTGKELNSKEKLALITAQIHHDEGYLVRNKMGEDGDHDKISSTIFENKHKDFYSETIFKDEEGRKYLEKAQEALGNHNNKTEYIEKFDDDNLINNCLLVSDKLSVYADEKLPEFLVDNKEAMAELMHIRQAKLLEDQGVITEAQRLEYEKGFREKLSNCIDVPNKEKVIDEISHSSAQFVLGMNNGRIGEISFIENEEGQLVLNVDIETIEKNSDIGEFLDNEYFYKKNKATGEMEAESSIHERSVEKIKGDFGDYLNENSGVRLNFKEIKEDEVDTEILEVTKEEAREWRDSKFLKDINEIAISDIQNLDKKLEEFEDLDDKADILHNRVAQINHYLDDYITENINEVTEEEIEAVHEISRKSLKTMLDIKSGELNEAEMSNTINKFKMESLKILNKERIDLLNKWKEM